MHKLLTRVLKKKKKKHSQLEKIHNEVYRHELCLNICLKGSYCKNNEFFKNKCENKNYSYAVNFEEFAEKVD